LGNFRKFLADFLGNFRKFLADFLGNFRKCLGDFLGNFRKFSNKNTGKNFFKQISVTIYTHDWNDNL